MIFCGFVYIAPVYMGDCVLMVIAISLLTYGKKEREKGTGFWKQLLLLIEVNCYRTLNFVAKNSPDLSTCLTSTPFLNRFYKLSKI